MIRSRYSLPVIIALLTAAGTPGDAKAAPTETEQQAICREAEGRYRDMFGRAPKEEPFTVVLMYKDTFCPRELSVKRGTRLRWINVDKRTSHSVWFKDAGHSESERKFPEELVEMIVDWPAGDYPYLCGPHGEKEGMIGRLTVRGD